MRFLPPLILFLIGTPSLADDPLRRETCLLGQETAALYYELLNKQPDQAETMLQSVNTAIARRAYYWAMVYVEKERTLDELTDTYLSVCMRTGAFKIPAPQI